MNIKYKIIKIMINMKIEKNFYNKYKIYNLFKKIFIM